MKKNKIDNLIPDAQFQKEAEQQIEFQLTTIHKLCKRDLGHNLEKPHKLGFNVIIIITQGEGIHTIDFVPHQYKKGTVFFIKKDQIHNFKLKVDSQGYLLAFTDNFLNRLIVNQSLNILHEMFDYIYYPVKMQLSNDSYDDCIKLLQVLEKEFSIKIDEFKELILKPLLQAMIIKLSRDKLSQRIPLDSKDKSLYLKFKQVSLNHNYSLHVNDYAKILDISSKTLTNMINKYLGKTTKKYLDEHLILQIKRLLLDKDLTIENISDKLYFDEPTNMVKFFKRYEKLTPSEFKKQYLI
jgi:AraC-like DNA-binding protein